MSGNGRGRQQHDQYRVGGQREPVRDPLHLDVDGGQRDSEGADEAERRQHRLAAKRPASRASTVALASSSRTGGPSNRLHAPHLAADHVASLDSQRGQVTLAGSALRTDSWQTGPRNSVPTGRPASPPTAPHARFIRTP